MVRVTRSVLLHVLALCSCAFLLFQICYYRKYVIKTEPRPPSPDSQWVSVRSFLSAAHSCRLPVFLIDVSVLNSISHNTPGRGHCNFLCQRPITAFGLNLKHWSHDSCFLSALDQKDFLWTLTSGLNQSQTVRRGWIKRTPHTHHMTDITAMFYNLKPKQNREGGF
uniref:Ribitol-5-phosphate transferase FKTN N-terminal domain-containing protein n=1 Tax=Knipowitschia caucasica TaxID=637954 RepID=A0AAV2IRV9_KNICA